MPLYLTRFSYTPATWAKKLIKKPEDRRAAAKKNIEVGRRQAARLLVRVRRSRQPIQSCGRLRITSRWPPQRSRSGSGGALSSIQTTVLLSVEDTLAVLEKASTHQILAAGRKGIADLHPAPRDLHHLRGNEMER